MSALSLASIYLVSEHLDLVPAPALDALEGELGTKLPVGYRDYVSRLGRGELCGILRVLDPDMVRSVRADFARYDVLRDAERQWSNFGKLLLTSDKPRLVSLARSIDGDELCFHLDDPRTLFVLPRHRDQVAAADGFEEALAWFASSGVYWDKTRRPWFEPSIRRVSREIACTSAERNVDDLLETLQGLEPDADDGNDPPATLFYRRAQAAVLVYSTRTVRMRMRCDEGCTSFLDEVVESVRAAGWNVV
jgi:hypothetical protein